MEKYYIKISEPGIYVPPHIITNSDLEKLVDTNDEWIIKRTGISERRFAYEDDVRSMWIKAALNLKEKTNFNPKKIDEISFSTNRHDEDQSFPNHAGYLGAKIGTRRGIPLSDLNAGCTGLIYSIRNSVNALIAEKDKFKIIAGASENLTGMTDYSDRNTCVLFGSGAGCYLIEKLPKISDEEGLINIIVKGDPDRGDNEWPRGYLAMEYKEGTKLIPKEEGGYKTYRHKQNYLIMQGNKIFDFAVKEMSNIILEVLEPTPYNIEDVDVIIPHGANIRITNSSENRLKKHGFKGIMYTNLNEFGNTSAAAFAIAEAEAREKEIIQEGQLIIKVAFGAGLTWGAIASRA